MHPSHNTQTLPPEAKLSFYVVTPPEAKLSFYVVTPPEAKLIKIKYLSVEIQSKYKARQYELYA